MTFRRLGLPILAFIGIGFAIFMIYWGTRKPPVTRIVFQPPTSPYRHFVAGEGVIEAINKNTLISVPFPELVTDVYVDIGQVVKKNAPLFKIDTRTLEAQLRQALQELATAQKLYEEVAVRFSFYERLKEKSAVSEQEYATALYDMKVARQRVETAQAAANVIRTNIARSTIRAPIEGEVLQVNIHVGEYANVNPINVDPLLSQFPLIMFGDTRHYHLRVDIDEEDAWRVVKGAPGTAYVRGNSAIVIPLTYVYTEPYIIPKVSLSGSNLERVDTRVLQVVYSFERKFPIYAGQLLDVFLEAKPSGAGPDWQPKSYPVTPLSQKPEYQEQMDQARAPHHLQNSQVTQNQGK